MKNHLCPLPLVLMAAMGLAMSPLAKAQQAFPTPDEAADALVAALGTDKGDPEKLAQLLGPGWKDFIPTDGVARADVDYFLKAYRTSHKFDTQGQTAHLSVGEGNWVLPVPLVQDAKGWHFDVKAGTEEIRTRRIGDNELLAVQSGLAYHDAQSEYAEVDHDGDGVLEYARKLLSTDGEHDGLYWAEDDSGQISPLGPKFGDAQPGGDWQGYHFRILEAQGASAPGGAYSYLLGDNMSRGFALVAWPTKHGDSGVMTFMVSHEGQVFQKDLGANGAAAAKAMKSFDPDSSWHEVPKDMEAVPNK